MNFPFHRKDAKNAKKIRSLVKALTVIDVLMNFSAFFASLR